MKKIICFILLLLLLSSCSVSPSFRIREYKSDYGYDVIVDENGEAVELITFKDVYSVSVNEMDYDYDSDEYTVKETLYQKEKFSKNDSLVIKLDLKAELPYVMLSYSLEKGQYFEQYIFRQNNNLLLLERENP